MTWPVIAGRGIEPKLRARRRPGLEAQGNARRVMASEGTKRLYYVAGEGDAALALRRQAQTLGRDGGSHRRWQYGTSQMEPLATGWSIFGAYHRELQHAMESFLNEFGSSAKN